MHSKIKNAINFRSYESTDKEPCLAIFDENTPKYFAVNEREDYATFLDSLQGDYEVCLESNNIIGAFGLLGEDPNFKNINWILISPKSQGSGVGSEIMHRAINWAKRQKLLYIKISASHLSAPFFAKYGAQSVLEIKDGWGINMHRVDMELPL